MKARKLLVIVAVALSATQANSQIILSRSDIGFDNSRSYFTGFTGNGLQDSILVGVPKADSSQTFDFSAIYYTFTCPSSWHEDTTFNNGRFENSHEVQVEVKPWDSQAKPDSVLTYYSTGSGNSSDTLFYFGEEDQTYSPDSIVLRKPLPMFVFPLRVGSHWADTTPANVGKTKSTVSINGDVDAYGTLFLPSGSYSSLRVKVFINYGTYSNYRYYYLTASPFISASLVALKSSNPASGKQLIFRASYTGPKSKYDHTVAPVLNMHFHGPDTARTTINGFDTLMMVCVNTGDTSAKLDYLYTSPSSAAFLLPSLNGKEVSAHDSVVIPIVFHPTQVGFVNTIVFLSAIALNGVSRGIAAIGGGVKKSEVSIPAQHETSLYQIYPQPASSSLHIRSITGSGNETISVELFNCLGREVVNLTGTNPSRQTDDSLFYNIEKIPSGYYFLHVAKGGHEEVHLVVILH